MPATRPSTGPLLLLLATLFTGCSTSRPNAPAAALPNNPWPRVQTVAPPLAGGLAAQVYGGYAGGCLRGAVMLPADGSGYQVMRLSRRRFFGHPSLVRFVTRLSRAAARLHASPLLIGDLAMPRGGPTNTNHRSHQNGLDVDIWFWQNADAAKRPLTAEERGSLSAPSMVTADGASLDPAHWSSTQARILKAAAAAPEVERIFVHAAIKRELCHRYGGRHQAWLKKLRPWYAHNDHFHVRLRCPQGDMGCTHQEAPPDSEECDASLDWWFSDEAKAKDKAYEAVGVPPMPKLPAECDAVLSSP